MQKRAIRFAALALAGATAGAILAGIPAQAVGRGGVDSATHRQQTTQLITFNGMYNLAGSPGAFVLVDAVMSRSVKRPEPQYVVSLVVSLDGTTSQSVNFTGSFDGHRLRQTSPDGMALDLTFTHRSRGLGPTAYVKGQVTLPGVQPVAVSGVSYDNPIQADFWNGQTFYLTPATGRGLTPVARIGKDGNLYYDNGRGDGKLSPVSAYTYNLDMYYYSFTDPQGDTANFIMGTSGSQGFAMNNLVARGGEPISTRNLTTIPRGADPSTKNWYPDFHLTQGPSSIQVGGDVSITDFSAYYPIEFADGKTNPKAFLSIDGSDLSLVPGIEQAVPGTNPGSLYSALITVSLDGGTTRNYYYDTSQNMSFDGRTLRMPRQHIEVTFTREYDAKTGSVFSMTGTIGTRRISGKSPFNPVPITQFAATMKDVSGKNTLVITPTGEITLNGQALTNYEYVPSMYIVAGPIPGTTLIPQPVTLISLGHGGASGMSAIVTTNYGLPQASTFNVYQIAPAA